MATSEAYCMDKRKVKCELYHDNFQNWKSYPIQKAQLVIADVPYNVGDAAYGSNPMWYLGGTTPTGKANLPKRLSLSRTAILSLPSICTFALNFSKRSRPGKSSAGNRRMRRA